jgi:multicomponent Na+:H+ antiporter subunit C
MAQYLILALFLLGVWGLVRKHNLIKKVISLSLINSALIILFVYLGSLSGSTAPIMIGGPGARVVDPLPQALTLTTIVIGICLTALALVLVARIYRHRGTLDIRLLDRAGSQTPSEGNEPEGGNDPSGGGPREGPSRPSPGGTGGDNDPGGGPREGSRA